MLFEAGFSFSNLLIDVLTIFAFIVWSWLATAIFADLFRRHDISPWTKALWGHRRAAGLVSWRHRLIIQGRGMSERNLQQAQAARDGLRRVVEFSVADEFGNLDQLRKAGSINDGEFARLRARLVQ